MAEFPALPLWTDSYLADCSHLTDAEHGIYFRLLMLVWRTPDCRIPNDDEWLARRLSKSVPEVKKIVRPLLQEFFISDGNFLSQKRLSKEFKFVRKLSRRGSVNAKSRWNKEKDSCETDAKDMQTSCNVASVLHQSGNAPTPTPTPTPQSKKKEAVPASQKTRKRVPVFNSVEFDKFWELFPRQRRGSPEKAQKAWQRAMRFTTAEKIIASVEEYAISREVVEGFAKRADGWLMDHGWESIYRPPDNKAAKNSSDPVEERVKRMRGGKS